MRNKRALPLYVAIPTFVAFAFAASVVFSAAVEAKGMVKFKVVGESIPKSLTGKKGDPKMGRKATINRKLGNCLSCHKLPVSQPYQGAIGPDLRGVASRLKEGEIRLLIVNSKIVNPDTIMPAFYRTKGFHRVQKKWQGKTLLSAAQVEDIIAYLMTLK